MAAAVGVPSGATAQAIAASYAAWARRQRGSQWVIAASVRAASISASGRVQYATARGAARMSAPLPAASRSRSRHTSRAAVSSARARDCAAGFGWLANDRPRRRSTAPIWLPTSNACRRQSRNRAATSSTSSSPWQVMRLWASAAAICASSVTPPGTTSKGPPPLMSSCGPVARVGNAGAGGVVNSSVVPSASPRARPHSAPRPRSRSAGAAQLMRAW